MANVRKHITISEEANKIVEKYQTGKKFSDAVERLIFLGEFNDELGSLIERNTKLVERLMFKVSYVSDLLDQFYTDMEIENLLNPKNNKALQKFKTNRDKLKYDD